MIPVDETKSMGWHRRGLERKLKTLYMDYAPKKRVFKGRLITGERERERHLRQRASGVLR